MIALILSILFSVAQASGWISIEADRGNLLYSPGDQAEFRLKQNVFMEDPSFYTETTIEQTGSAPAPITFTAGRGFFQSAALNGSNKIFRVITKLKETNSTWESTVQDETIELQLSEGTL